MNRRGFLALTALAAPMRALLGPSLVAAVQTIDGVPLVPGERWLITGVEPAKLNGVWEVTSGSWSRPADFEPPRVG